MMGDIDIGNKKIVFSNRRQAYLMDVELFILQEYLKLGRIFPNSENQKYLFIRRKCSCVYDDVVMDKGFICDRVKEFSGFTPQTLRITCLSAMVTYNSPHFLIQAYGISQTHAGRFGKYEEYLLEQKLKSTDCK